ncbi:hypothetical protein Poli38472_013000 [Pythium oligandrum]|uniref:Uncharacterized protein n=1 Tax=Pythium oligandrum TaxID=41045 RepID=A0A8K1FN76_PYTOL|nr:hypothetical protein Poli38472_013000 [Pythium oligandrum]|eukprot:TMW64378.1 hypothetical protein Poli38472_013000 [Pythium oligandrum]
MEVSGAMLALLLFVTIAIPLLYVVITWEHGIVNRYPVLPAPSDLGTKEFRWRCYLSSWTRRGWKKAILRSPCPRLTLQSRFALLSTDFAKLTTSLGFKELKLETIPCIFPQVAVSGLMLQLLGNSNFPAALTGLRLKAVTICQLRPLDMRFRDEPIAETSNAQEEEQAMEGLNCVMVLTEKRILEDEIEFLIQTDIFDDQGTVWQSTTCLAVPFYQKTLLVPLSVTAAQLDATLCDKSYDKLETNAFACSTHHLEEFEDVNVTNLDGTATDKRATPLLWALGRAMGVLQQTNRVPTLPLLCSFVCDDANDVVIPLQSRVECESSVATMAAGAEERLVTKVELKHDQRVVVSGFLRTVGWVFEEGATAEQ